MSSKHINKVLRKAVSDILDNINGAVSVDEINSRVIDELPAKLNFEDFVITAIAGEVNNQLKTRSVEKEVDPEEDLFPETLDEKLLSYTSQRNKKLVLKFKDAKLEHLMQYETRQIANLEKVKARIELWDKRREILYPIMKENPNLTAREALEIASNFV